MSTGDLTLSQRADVRHFCQVLTVLFVHKLRQTVIVSAIFSLFTIPGIRISVHL